MPYVGGNVFFRPCKQDDLLSHGVRHSNFVENVGVSLRAVRNHQTGGANTVPDLFHEGTWRKLLICTLNYNAQLVGQLLDMFSVDFFQLCLEWHKGKNINFLFYWSRSPKDWNNRHTFRVSREKRDLGKTHPSKGHTNPLP